MYVQTITCGGTPDIHVITIPIQDEFRESTASARLASKPPDYETAIGTKPPSYDEAIRISPALLLHHPHEPAPPYPAGQSMDRTSCSAP